MQQQYEVLVGGTFGPFHDGHRKLLTDAIAEGPTIVGVTDDELAQDTRDEPRPVPLAEERAENVRDYLSQFNIPFEVRIISEPEGPAVEREDVSKIVVTPEEKTQKRVSRINEKRVENNSEPLEMIISWPAFAEDGERISSTRIVNGEIDEHGLIQ